MDGKKTLFKKERRQFSQQFSLRDMLLTQILAILNEGGTEFSEEIERVKAFLLDFIPSEKNDFQQQFLMEKTSDILATSLMRIQLMLNSMQMPLSQLDSRLQTLKAKIREAEQQKITLGDLLDGERKRLVNYIDEQASELRIRARTHLLAIVEEHLVSYNQNLKDDLLDRKTIAEIPVFFEAELKKKADAFNQKIREVLVYYKMLADELIEAVRKNAYDLFDITYHAPKSFEAFEIKKEPYLFKMLNTKISHIPKTIVGSVLPAKLQQSMTRKQYTERVEKLVINNVENLRWTALQAMDHLFRTFGTTLDERMQAAIVSTHSALQAVRDKRSDPTHSLLPEITRMQDIKVKLEIVKRKCDAGKIY